MEWRQVILFICFLMQVSWATKKSQNMDPVDVTEWGLPADEKYFPIYQLTEANFKPKVFGTKDPWIVVVFKDKLHGKWRRHAEYLKGSIWYGTINYDKEQKLAKKWGITLTDINSKSGVGLVFPYGKGKKENIEIKKKGQWPRIAEEPKIAGEIATDSIPDYLEKLDFRPQSMKGFQNWVIDSYYHSDPPKFPVVCITDEPEPFAPPSLLMISKYFSNFFAFGIVRKENIERMRSHFQEVPAPTTFPHYLVLLGKEPSQEEMDKGSFGMSFNIFPFNKEKYGESTQFQSVVKYLFTANEDYREILPGRHAEEHMDISNLVQVQKELSLRLKTISQNYKPKKSKKEEL